MADIKTADIVTAVRNKLSDSSFDVNIVIDALNAFVAQIYHDTKTVRMETSDVIQVATGDTTADFPDDLDTRVSLTVTAPSAYDLTSLYLEYGDFMKQYPKWQTSGATQVQRWTDYANQIRFSAPALTATTIAIDYLRKPVPAALIADDLSMPTDSVELDQSYKELAVTGTYARSLEAIEEYSEASSERNNLLPLITAWVTNEGRGGGRVGPIVMRTNRVPGRWGRTRDW